MQAKIMRVTTIHCGWSTQAQRHAWRIGDCTLYSSGKIAARPKSKAETTDVEQLSNDRDDGSAGPEDED